MKSHKKFDFILEIAYTITCRKMEKNVTAVQKACRISSFGKDDVFEQMYDFLLV